MKSLTNDRNFRRKWVPYFVETSKDGDNIKVKLVRHESDPAEHVKKSMDYLNKCGLAINPATSMIVLNGNNYIAKVPGKRYDRVTRQYVDGSELTTNVIPGATNQDLSCEPDTEEKVVAKSHAFPASSADEHSLPIGETIHGYNFIVRDIRYGKYKIENCAKVWISIEPDLAKHPEWTEVRKAIRNNNNSTETNNSEQYSTEI